MLTLTEQCREYAADPIYIKGDAVYLSICLSMFVQSLWPNLWMDFSETWHDDRF